MSTNKLKIVSQSLSSLNVDGYLIRVVSLDFKYLKKLVCTIGSRSGQKRFKLSVPGYENVTLEILIGVSTDNHQSISYQESDDGVLESVTINIYYNDDYEYEGIDEQDIPSDANTSLFVKSGNVAKYLSSIHNYELREEMIYDDIPEGTTMYYINEMNGRLVVSSFIFKDDIICRSRVEQGNIFKSYNDAKFVLSTVNAVFSKCINSRWVKLLKATANQHLTVTPGISNAEIVD